MAKSKKRVTLGKGQIKATSNLTGSLKVQKPKAIISTSTDDITVASCDKNNVEHESIWPSNTPSDVIFMNTAADLGLPMKPSYQERFTEAVKEVRETYTEEIELSIWPPKIRIKKTPKKIIKYFKAKEATLKKPKKK